MQISIKQYNLSLLKWITEQQVAEIEQAAADKAAEPCPFCGSDDVILYVGYLMGRIAVATKCTNCHCRTEYLTEGTTGIGKWQKTYTLTDRVNEALQTWNRRTQSPPQSQSAER